MKLTDNDYDEIAGMVTEGRHTIEYDKGGETLFLDCVLETDGYVEDDTDAWVETSRDFTVESAESYDLGGEKTENDFDFRTLERKIA